MMKDILYSTLHNRCPKCHETTVFKVRNAFNLKHFMEMNEVCSVCNEKYEKEPGYYFGAMYVSYALMVALFVTTWVLNSWLIHAGIITYFISLVSIIVLLAPLTFRLSRLIWLNFFISYNPGFSKTKKIKS